MVLDDPLGGGTGKVAVSMDIHSRGSFIQKDSAYLAHVVYSN